MQENANLFNVSILETILSGSIGALLGGGAVWLVLTVVPFFSDLKGNAIGIMIGCQLPVIMDTITERFSIGFCQN